jgi:hypothetical protein
MARYNTIIPTATAASATSITSPNSGALVSFTGTTYSVSIGDPVLFSGLSQIFYNAASGTITLTFTSVGAGVFVGPGASGTTSQLLTTGSTVTLYSDGTNWVVLGASGGPISGSTGSFSGNVTLSGTTPTLNLNNTAPTIATNNSGSTASLFDSNATTVNAFGAATTITVGATTGTLNLRNTTITAANATTLNLNGTSPSIVTSSTGTGSVFNTNIGTGNLFGSATTVNLGTGGTTITIGASSSGTATIRLTTASSTTSNGALVVAGGVGVAGQVTCATLVETSSIAFKENVQPLTNALDVVMQLMGVTYDRKDNKRHEAGLIAEEVFKFAPELVSLDADGKPYGIQYTKLGAYLVESIKVLKQEIDFLKNKE